MKARKPNIHTLSKITLTTIAIPVTWANMPFADSKQTQAVQASEPTNPSILVAQTSPDQNLPNEDDIEITVIEEILEQPIYTPFRSDGILRESSRPAYVIDRQEIQAQGATTVQEALKYLPGIISAGTTGGELGSLPSQFMRGANSDQVLILLDGRPINNTGFSGSFDLASITTDTIEQIEVVPGGGSTLYGSNAIGGIINIITRKPNDEPTFSANLEAGSFGYNQQQISSTGTIGDISWVVGYNRTASANDFPFSLESFDFQDTRENADVLYNNVNLKLSADIDQHNQLTFTGLYNTRDLGVAGGVPIPGSNRVGSFNSLTSEARQYTDELMLDLTWKSQLGSSDDSLLTARVYRDSFFYRFSNPDPENPGTLNKVRSNVTGLQVQHNWQFANNQTITYGGDYRNVNAENTTFDFQTGVEEENYDDNISQGAVFARYEADVTPDFSVNAGLRQEFSNLEEGDFTSPSVGFRWQATDSTVVRGNYTRNFQLPLIRETSGLAGLDVEGNPDLDPERGNSFDVGIDQQLGDFGLLRLTGFFNDVSDLIAFEFGNPSTYRNVGRVQTWGLEAALDVQLARNVYAFGNYTLNETEIIDDATEANEGNELPFRGADTFNLGVAYETPDRFYAALLLHGVSDFYVDDANDESLDGRTTLDLKVRVPVSDRFAVNASLNNILDEEFELYPGFPGMGINFRLGVRSTF